jgi:hypothetical protein
LNKLKLGYVILKALEKGDIEPKATDFGIEMSEFRDVVMFWKRKD